MKPQRRLDVTSVAGVPVAIGFVVLGQALEGGTLQSLVQLTAALIVFGGTFGAVLLSHSVDEVRQAWRGLRHVFYDEQVSPHAIIDAISRLAMKARRDGIMSLDDEAEQIEDPFMRRGLMLAVDGTNPSTLRTMLEAESFSRDDIDETPAKVFESAGGYAPTIGILGAVLGLIHVMENLTDTNNIGDCIAVAFVATIYGVGSANLLFLPVASKLRSRAVASAKRRELMLEGILAIQEGLNPRLIDQKLRGLIGSDVTSRPVRQEARAA
ncbi:MAG: flagellar motor protein [Vicinamibacterales bacterium]|nr:flagellar motor protein [Vicinamibacterales bacterium]